MKNNITLALATANDIEYLVEIKTNNDFWPYGNDNNLDKNVQRQRISERITGGHERFKQFIILLTGGGKTVPVGELHIYKGKEERKCWEFGYCIFREFQGKGYATQASRIALTSAFKEWGAHKIIAQIAEINAPSLRVMEKLGFTREAVFREELPWNGGWINQYQYSLLEHEASSLSRKSS